MTGDQGAVGSLVTWYVEAASPTADGGELHWRPIHEEVDVHDPGNEREVRHWLNLLRTGTYRNTRRYRLMRVTTTITVVDDDHPGEGES